MPTPRSYYWPAWPSMKNPGYVTARHPVGSNRALWWPRPDTTSDRAQLPPTQKLTDAQLSTRDKLRAKLWRVLMPFGLRDRKALSRQTQAYALPFPSQSEFAGRILMPTAVSAPDKLIQNVKEI